MEANKGKALILHDTALKYLKTKEKTAEETIAWLQEQGISREKSQIVVEKLQQQIIRHKKGDRLWTILGGLSMCSVGILLTILQTGYIWWGAIIFGGIAFLKGLTMDID